MKRWTIGLSVAALIAVPALAWTARDDHKPMPPQTRAEAEAKVKALFTEIDTDKDGAITKEELQAFRDTKRDEMRDAKFASLDSDKNGQISREEFDAPRDHDGPDRHHMRGPRGHGMIGRGAMFAAADTNNDGKVTLQEATTKSLELFDKADANKDGTISPEERKAARKAWFENRAGHGA